MGWIKIRWFLFAFIILLIFAPMAEISPKPRQTPCFSCGSRPSQSYRSPDLLWTSSVRPDDQSGSCLIWQTSPLFFLFPFLKNGFFTAPLPLRSFLMRHKQTVGGSAEEPDASRWFYVRCLLYFFRISSGCDFQILFFLGLSLCPPFVQQTRQKQGTQNIFITSISLHK